ncbi:MAG: hypothetical protein M1816_000412 [Peltula sp. TS41687]|nr:MAG: hypothetical protein M1816_000412 [Peltula sp. TS41687]
MSDLQKEWLGSLLKRELSTLLSAHQEGTSGSKKGSAVILKQDERGFEVTIATDTLRTRIVQLLKFHSFDSPTQAIVSDSNWMIVAEFRPSAISSFEASNYNQRITQGTVGGLVQILGNCELVINSNPPLPAKFLLVIHDCQFRGSAGSSVYGDPRELRSSAPIQNLLQDLSSIPEREFPNQKSMFNSDADSSQPCSQAGSGGNAEKANGASPRVCVSATQASLLTQLPAKRNQSSGSAGPRPILTAQTPTESQATTSQRCGDEKLVSNKLELINLLKSRGQLSERVPQTPYSHQSERPLPRSSTGPSTHQCNEQTDIAKSPSVLQSSLSTHGQSWIVTPLSDGKLLLELNDTSCGRQQDSRARRSEALNADSPSAVKKLTRLIEDSGLAESRKTKKENKRLGDSTKHHRTNPNPEILKMDMGPTTGSTGFSSFTCSKDEDPWQGMTAIQKRETRIPKDQQRLLESKDCWYPPEPGSRGPVANIPVRLLQLLSDMAERKLHKTPLVDAEVGEPARSGTHSERSPSPESGSLPPERDKHDDTGSPHSTSYTWSPSPPRPARCDQLPPDSSGPDIETNNGGFQSPKGLNHRSVLDNHADDDFEEPQPSKTRRTENMESPKSTAVFFDQGPKSYPSSLGRLVSHSKSVSSEKQSAAQSLETNPQNSNGVGSDENSPTSHANISASKAGCSQRSFPRIIDSGCDVDDSDMESCLPTALGEKVQGATEAEAQVSKKECRLDKRKARPADEASSISGKRIKLERLFTFDWEEDRQYEDLSSNLRRVKAEFFAREAAKAARSSPILGSSSVINPSSNTSAIPREPNPSSPSSSILITPSKTEAAQQHMIKPSSPSQSTTSDSISAIQTQLDISNSPTTKPHSSPDKAAHQKPTSSNITFAVVIPHSKRCSSTRQHSARRAPTTEVDVPRSPSLVHDSSAAIQLKSLRAHSASSRLPTVKETTNPISPGRKDPRSEPPQRRRASRSNVSGGFLGMMTGGMKRLLPRFSDST